MGDPRGFLKVKRQASRYRPVCERVKDFSEVGVWRTALHSQEQASRCMDCGTPFCHWGCPVGNFIPEWNDLVFHGRWREALSLLSATNNLPEITGRICPAPCEFACVLGINDDPVTIRENELSIIEHAFRQGYIQARRPQRRTGKNVAVIGSGPAGLSCAAQLNQAGHRVAVFEKDDKAGGILRYGIPDFKLDKRVIDRRIRMLRQEGIEFRTSVNVGRDYQAKGLRKEFDAACLAGGCRVPRDLNIAGRDLGGIYFAMDYLIQANKRVAGCRIPAPELIDLENKRVVVIGGGDTGADCVGAAHRQNAACVVQIELLPRPAECRTEQMPWPRYPMILKTSTSHEEGGERRWAVLTKRFVGEGGWIKKLSCIQVEFPKDDIRGCPVMREIPGTEFEIETDAVILALGFMHPERKGLISELEIKLDSRGNIQTDANFMTSVKGIFSAGDMRRGSSLVVWAISEGRRAAYSMDKYLMGESYLPNI